MGIAVLIVSSVFVISGIIYYVVSVRQILRLYERKIEHLEKEIEQLKIEIVREVSELKEQLIIENRAMINAAIAEINEKVDASLAEIKSEIEEDIDDKIALVDASIAFNSSVLAGAIIEL